MSVNAAMAGFPEKIWLGIKTGQWPVEAFVNEDHALIWAADANQQQARYIIGPLELDLKMPTRRARKVPESRQWIGDAP